MQAAPGDPVLDRVSAHSARKQLPASHHSVLSRDKLPNRLKLLSGHNRYKASVD
jgi:hypothetical protein